VLIEIIKKCLNNRNNMEFKFFVEIIRPLNCIMAAIAVFIGYAISIGNIAFNPPLLFAMLAGFFVCAGGQVVNDFFDVETDKKIRPQKILPSKKISIKAALFYSILLFMAGLIFASLINDFAFIIAAAFTTILILYSAFMKNKKILGNIVVALGTAFTLIFGASIVQNYVIIIFLATSAFFANFGREIIKDVEDIKADEGFKKSLPMILSQKKINLLVLLFYYEAIIIAFYVWFAGLISSIFYLSLILIAGFIFMYSFLLLKTNKIKQAQVFSKVAMAVSLLAYLAGVF